MPSHHRLLRRVAVTTALVTGVLTASPGLATAALAGPAATAPPAASPAAAPQAAGSASGFLLYILPDGDPTCLVPLGLDASDDPAIDRAACAFVDFTVAGATGQVTVDLYAEGSDTPFAQDLATTPDSADPTLHQVSLDPDDTWPAGAVRLVVKDTAGRLGEFRFLHNALRTTDLQIAPETSKPGDKLTVTGTIEMHSARATWSDAGVPATFDLVLTDATGKTVYAQEVTAGSDGTFTHEVPAGATKDVAGSAATDYRTALKAAVVNASYEDGDGLVPTGQWAAETAGTASHTVVSPATQLDLANSFVSSVGWVKPGEEYPSRIIVTNPTGAAATPQVTLSAPQGSSFVSAAGPGTHDVAPGDTTATWSPGALAPGARATLVLKSKAATTDQLATIVWRDLSSTAVLKVGGTTVETVDSHGPKVIPPADTFDTARYGDRPFPVVPVQYTDLAYQAAHDGGDLEQVINDPGTEGSTFNLFQEMSLGQLFPHGTVPSAGKATADFGSYEPGFEFSTLQLGQTCVGGTTLAGVQGLENPLPYQDTALYPERITNGVYNLPGNTAYYGADANGSAILGSVLGVGALQNIDSGCGPAGKLVYDAAVIADPEIDYSDYDTDKDGVVDFFMAVFAGCGGNGASQLSVAGCEYANLPYDNVWPHSSSLEYYYTDPETGQAGYVTDDQLKDLEGRPLYYTSAERNEMTTQVTEWKVFVRVGPYNVNPETAIDKASVISHEYGHSLGLPDFYSTGGRATYGSWNLMAEDRSQNMDAFSRQELGWVVPKVLPKGRKLSVTGWRDSKEDIDQITWQTEDGTPYTLKEGRDGRVQNSEMYVAKLPGRQLLDPASFETGETASKTHAWWSGSGNDFGCAPQSGRNLDISIPALASIPADSKVTLTMKSLWDIEWDFDYGFVLTTTDGGKTYTSNASEKGYTTSNTDLLAGNPNQNTCQAEYDNGLTGTSGSYQAGSEALDRKIGNTPPAVFLSDEYDISELAGSKQGALRFSYATDPGLARPGWFIDDLKVTVTEPGKPAYDVLVTDLEKDGGPDDARFFNGGCKEDLTLAQRCTQGWKYLQAGAESEQDHAYYLELRDRSGFDLDGNDEADRGPATFQPGLSLVYTDEAHGYGNAGTDDPPAQSPLDSTPEPGIATPNLDDAAFTAAADRSTYTDAGEGHTDNYSDPGNSEVDQRYPDVTNPWRFRYDCLTFKVTSMSGNTDGPQEADGDLTANVDFDLGQKCGAFDYGYGEAASAPANTAPTAEAAAQPAQARTGQRIALTAAGSTDKETPEDLEYIWDFDNGGDAKDAYGPRVSARYADAGVRNIKLTVLDPEGLSDTDTVKVTVTGDGGGNAAPTARANIDRERPLNTTRVKLSGTGSEDPEGTDLTYSWDFGNGGSKVDATGRVVRTVFRKTGPRTVTLTVTDEDGAKDTDSLRVFVRRSTDCSADAVTRTGSWREVGRGNGHFCDNRGQGAGKDTMTMSFRGPVLDVVHGRMAQGGWATVWVDDQKVGKVQFSGPGRTVNLGHHQRWEGLGAGIHTMRLVVGKGQAYVQGFITTR